VTTATGTALCCAGRLVTVTGTVVRASGTRPLVTAMGFACGSCGEEHLRRFDDGVYMWVMQIGRTLSHQASSV
jgi:DNA replicative helicase MCM subunit Mcm2 (Cdc46/Mcm family)